MAQIHIIQNAFNPRAGMVSVSFTDMSLMDFVREYRDESEIDFEHDAWLCIAYTNNRRFYPLREEWDSLMLDDETSVFFMPYVGEGTTLVVAVVALIISILAVVFIQPPKIEDAEDQQSVYSLDGNKNKVRANGAIEDPYGRNKLWPTYAALPYVRFENDLNPNNAKYQFLYQTFCLGHGSYSIEDVLLEDTPINFFEEATYQIFQPNEHPDLFPWSVHTAQEVNRLELFGNDESEYLNGNEGWIGGFVCVPSGRVSNKIEIDIELPNGIIDNDYDGVESFRVDYDFQIAQIDEDNNQLTPFISMFPDGGYTIVAKTVNAIRETHTFMLDSAKGLEGLPTPARYIVRGRKTNRSGDATKENTLLWTSLRAFMDDPDHDFGNVTMMQVRTKASSNTVSNRINVVATRNVPTWDETGWQPETPNRNPVWAALNILRAEYGGRKPDSELDLPTFKALADEADANNETFDWVFDRKGTIWESLKACLVPIRTTPIMQGSLVTAVRDRLVSVPTQLFNIENTLSGTFKYQRRIYSADEYDGLEVTYLDSSNWKEYTILCLLNDQVGINPRKVKLLGVTDRDKAYELGNYQLGTEFYAREQLTFSVGFEGVLSTYGDTVLVANDIPKYGQSGYMKSIANGNTINLSEEVTFEGSDPHYLTVRDVRGNAMAPIEVIAGSNSKQVVSLTPLDESLYPMGGNHEPPLYIFGAISTAGRLCRLMSVKPAGSEAVKLTAVVEDSRRFDKDGELAPPLTYPDPEPSVPVPVIETLDAELNAIDPNMLDITWVEDPAYPAAEEFVIDISTDGYNWEFVALTSNTNYQMITPEFWADGFLLRVAGSIDVDGSILYGQYKRWAGIPVQAPVGFAVSATDTFAVSDVNNFNVDYQHDPVEI